MAKIPETEVTEKMLDAVANQFIKYNSEYLKAGDKFKVKESDVKELNRYADIEIPEEPAEGENGGE